jgi:hypothetical protein
MNDINKKSLLLAIILGFLAWFWAFIIVGFAFFDYSTNQPIANPNIVVYVTMLLINAIVSITIFALYIWKYEQKNPIIANKWAINAIVLGAIICGLNFLLDALFFGMMGRNLLSYFWLETTTGYFYPAIIFETYILAFLIYGRKIS